MSKNIIAAEWRNYTFEPGLNLTECYIDCDFYMATLNAVRLSGEFINCTFTAAEMRFCRIVGAKFKNCKFKGANIKDTAFRTSIFEACDFTGANFENTSGTTGCVFEMDCLGLFEISGDCMVEYIPELDQYEVYPEVLKHIYGGKGWKGLGLGKEVRTETESDPKTDELVDPELLPHVEHYRSPPIQIPESKKSDETDETDEWEDEEYYACGWYSWIPREKDKYRYGYMTNAVLECPDIEEFRKWIT